MKRSILCRRIRTDSRRLFLPLVGQEFPQDFVCGVGREVSHSGEDVGKIFISVNMMQSAGTGQREEQR